MEKWKCAKKPIVCISGLIEKFSDTLTQSTASYITNEVNLRHGITQAQLSLEESTYFGQSFSTSSNENLTNKWNNYYDGSDDDRKNDENLYRLVPK